MKDQKIILAILCVLTLVPWKTEAQHSDSPFSWNANFSAEEMSNLRGGLRRGSMADGLAHLTGTYDTEKAQWWPGGQLTLGLLGIYSSRRTDLTGGSQSASDIQASSRIRFHELVYAQKWNETLTSRLGLMDLNDYFNVTRSAFSLMHSFFGTFPTLTVNTLAATYPLSGVGAIGSFNDETHEAQIGIFQGDPYHTRTVFHRGHMLMGEVGRHLWFEHSNSPVLTVKIGAWRYRQANPILGNTTNGIYGISEARWGSEEDRNFSAFLQLGTNTRKRDTVRHYAGAGLRSQGLFESRPRDVLSLGIARAWILANPSEVVHEIMYSFQLTPELSLRPDLQYIRKPSGTRPNAVVGILRLHAEFI